MANGSSPWIGARRAMGAALVLGVMVLVSVAITLEAFAILALAHLLTA